MQAYAGTPFPFVLRASYGTLDRFMDLETHLPDAYFRFAALPVRAYFRLGCLARPVKSLSIVLVTCSGARIYVSRLRFGTGEGLSIRASVKSYGIQI